ncbi:hypothetical protein KEM55_006822, partial [Ascosphaera atra]
MKQWYTTLGLGLLASASLAGKSHAPTDQEEDQANPHPPAGQSRTFRRPIPTATATETQTVFVTVTAECTPAPEVVETTATATATATEIATELNKNKSARLNF